MCFRKLPLITVCLISILATGRQACALGAKPDPETLTDADASALADAPSSPATMRELARLYWPDSTATQLQQEEALKNLLGKKVSWEIRVAQIQRDGAGYRIQGQSDEDMIGTFSYVVPRNREEEDAVRNARMGDILPIVGIASDMDMRHIILKPAFIQSGE